MNLAAAICAIIAIATVTIYHTVLSPIINQSDRNLTDPLSPEQFRQHLALLLIGLFTLLVSLLSAFLAMSLAILWALSTTLWPVSLFVITSAVCLGLCLHFSWNKRSKLELAFFILFLVFLLLSITASLYLTMTSLPR